jgi:hypothetical protein
MMLKEKKLQEEQDRIDLSDAVNEDLGEHVPVPALVYAWNGLQKVKKEIV